MRNTNDELTLLTPAEVARQFPHRPCARTVMRWHMRGLKVGAQRVKLDGVRCGRRLFFRPQDVSDFAERLAQAERDRQDEPTPAERRRDRQARRERDIQAAERELAAN